jgi:hypothetical protein
VTVKATTVLAMINWARAEGISFASTGQRRQLLRRGGVPYREVSTQYPAKGFVSLEDARCWASRFPASR